MPGKPDTNKIPVALGAGYAYFRAAERLYDELNEKYIAAKNSTKGGILNNPGEISPLISSVSFAIELLLKVLTIQDTSYLPPKNAKHNINGIYNALAKDIRESLEVRYKKHFTEIINDGKAPYVTYKLSNAADPASTEPSQTFAKAIKKLNGSFERWRYMYELEGSQPGYLYFNFIESRCVAHALQLEIKEFKGAACVKFEQGIGA